MTDGATGFNEGFGAALGLSVVAVSALVPLYLTGRLIGFLHNGRSVRIDSKDQFERGYAQGFMNGVKKRKNLGEPVDMGFGGGSDEEYWGKIRGGLF